MNLNSLKWPDGQKNPSGIGSRIFVAYKSDITGFPAPPESPSTPADGVKLSGDFVMASGKTFSEIYSTQGKGKVEFSTEGEKDVRLFKVTGTFKYPDMDAEAAAFAASIINSNCIAIVPTRSSKKAGFRWVVIGGETYDSDNTASGTSGEGPGSDKGLTAVLTSYDDVAFKEYAGELALEGGTYDCDSNVFTPSS